MAATLLQCGHVYCRRCVIHLVQSSTPCPACGQTVAAPPGTTVSQRVQAMSQELVLQDLVTQRLAAQGLQPSDVCCNRDATSHCLDCGEKYCDACSAAHRKMTKAADHEIKTLPAVLFNDPAGAQDRKAAAATRPGIRTDSTVSIINQPVQLTNIKQPRRGDKWKAAQIQQLRNSVSEYRNLSRVCEDVTHHALRVGEQVKQKEEILNIYIDTLDHASVREQSDSLSYVTGLSSDDVTAEVILRDFERRLCDVRRMGMTCVDELGRLELELKQLSLTVDKYGRGESHSKIVVVVMVVVCVCMRVCVCVSVCV